MFQLKASILFLFTFTVTTNLAFSPKNYSFVDLGASSLAFTEDLNFCSAIISNTITLFKQSKGKFTKLNSIKPLCSDYTCTILHHYMTEDGSRIIVFSN